MSEFNIDPWFSHLAETNAVGIMMFDADGVIQFVSGPARNLMGCAEEQTVEDCVEPIAKHLEDMVTKCGCGEESDTTNYSQTVECEFAGNPRRIRLDATRIDIESCQGTMVQVLDLQIEESIQRDLRLASRFRNVGQLYQSIAHDLRNPVGLIRMYANLLRGTFDLLPDSASKTMAKQSELLGVISDAIKTMDQSLDLLFDELIVTEDGAGAIDVREAVAAVTRLAEAQAKRQQVTVTGSLPGETVYLAGNESKFRLALLNIANNALQAMPLGGKLSIDTEFGEQEITIAIADSGDGISEQTQGRIFEKYFSTKKSGTGIGLHIAREAVEELGGRVDVESIMKNGTTFRITIPKPANRNQ